MPERNGKKKGKKKKFGADTEMGYCPFEHKAVLGAGLGTGCVGVHGRDTHRRAAQHRRCARMRHGRAGARREALGRSDTGALARGVDGRRAREARGLAGHGRLGGLGALLANGLYTWCTQPVFYPV